MLWDPSKDKPIKVDEPTLEGFIAWLERQSPDAPYQYMPCQTCAIGQYLQSIGTSYFEQVTPMFKAFCDWNISIADPMPRTFGAALDRARRALACRE